MHSVGTNFKRVNNFLWPFKLSSPLGGMKKKAVYCQPITVFYACNLLTVFVSRFFVYTQTHFIEGGDCGNREEKINGLIRQMN